MNKDCIVVVTWCNKLYILATNFSRISNIKDVWEIFHVDPVTIWKVGINDVNFWRKNRWYFKSISNDEAVLNIFKCIVVQREVIKQRVKTCRSILRSLKQTSVQEPYVGESVVKSCFCPPHKSFVQLIDIVRLWRVSNWSCIGEERCNLYPTSTHLTIVSDVANRTANIRSSHWDAEQVEVHLLRNGVFHIFPRSVIHLLFVSSISARSRKRTTWYQKGNSIWNRQNWTNTFWFD